MYWDAFPQCEKCWISANSLWDNKKEEIHIKEPVRLKSHGIEYCAWCNQLTIAGIYVRASSEEVNYPRRVDWNP